MTSTGAPSRIAAPPALDDTAPIKMQDGMDRCGAALLVEQVKLLYVGTFALPANLACTLIVAAARTAGCATLLTEDLAEGMIYDGVTISNPFRRPPRT